MQKIALHGDPKRPEIFWGEMAPCEHMVQMWNDEGAFIDTLEGYAGNGLTAGDGVVVIGTPAHLAELERRLEKRGLDLAALRRRDQFITCDAESTLEQFMVDGWPDALTFENAVLSLVTRARGKGRRVRAFGEMVAILWARGNAGATVRLEHLWHALCKREGFSLLCAYPSAGFAQDADTSVKQICEAHSVLLTCAAA